MTVSYPPLLLHNVPTRGVHLEWPMDLQSQGLTVYIVEPTHYAPAAHAGLFGELIAAALAPPGRGGQTEDARRGLARFDLMTFPEAFLSSDDFLATLPFLAKHQASPIFHVGLRASVDHHLFTVAELVALIAAVRRIPGVEPADLEKLSQWAAAQLSDEKFNLAALVVVDADGMLRVCIHPKNVPSPIEASLLPGETVTGADFLCAVTLKPKNGLYRRVVVQPLICSDLLDLRTARGGPGPMEAMCSEADRLEGEAPDHVDVISAVTCTPQDDLTQGDGGPKVLRWKQKFLRALGDAYTRAGLNRHDTSIFVLSNFRYGPQTDDGVRPDQGLSGCCIPAPPAPHAPAGVCVWGHGRDAGSGQDIWKAMDDIGEAAFAPARALIVIDPQLPDPVPVAKLMSFTLPVLPRSQARQSPSGATQVLISSWPPANDTQAQPREPRYV